MRAGIAFAAAVLATTAGTAQAQSDWKPSGNVEMVIHTGAGGGNDAFIRAVALALQKDKALPFNMVFSNKTGGGSINAMNYLNSKKGDPNTIGIFSSVWVTDGLVQEAAPLTIDKLTPISNLVLEPAIAVVRADSPYKTLQDFVDAAKAKPGQLKQSGGSVLARDAVVRFVLMGKTGANWSFISFPSGGERISALLGGHVDIMFIEPSEAGELIRSGKLRPLAAVGEKRLEGYPDVPTLKEAGFDVPDVPQARGIVGPPEMPAEAVKYYSDFFKKVSESPSYREYLAKTQLENAYMDSAKTKEFLASYTNNMRNILKGAGQKVVR
jgi:putative tricarboxylic transport membrane protein